MRKFVYRISLFITWYIHKLRTILVARLRYVTSLLYVVSLGVICEMLDLIADVFHFIVYQVGRKS